MSSFQQVKMSAWKKYGDIDRADRYVFARGQAAGNTALGIGRCGESGNSGAGPGNIAPPG